MMMGGRGGRRGGGGHRGGPPGSRPVEKAKDAKGALVNLLKLLMPHRILVVIIVIMAIASTVFTIYSPKVTARFINNVVDGLVSQFTHKMTEDATAGNYQGVADSINDMLNQNLSADDVKKIFVYAQISGVDLQSVMTGNSDDLQAFIDKINAMRIPDEDMQTIMTKLVVYTQMQNIDKTAIANMSADDLNSLIAQADQMDMSQIPQDTLAQITAAMQKAQTDMQAATGAGDTSDQATYGIDFAALGKLALLLIGLYLLSAIFSYVQQFTMAVITQQTMFELRNKVNQKLSRMPLAYFDATPKGEIMSRMTNDIDNISMSLQMNMTQMVTAITTIVGIIIMMFTINVVMTFISLATIPVSLIILMLIMPHSRKYFSKQWDITGDLNGHIEEIYTGHNIVKAFTREDQAAKDFKEMNNDLFKTSRMAQFLSGMLFPLMTFVNNVGYVLICVAGGIFAVNGKIQVGDIQAMINYSRNLTQQVNQSSNIINTIQSALASTERVFNLLAEPEEIPETVTETLAPINNEVAFENVEFYYSEDKPLITDMSLNVKAGDMVAIVGPTGAGKTTLVNLLMRFYDVRNGAIKVNNVDIRHVSRNDLRNIFGMVLQDTWLFSGTIYENIAYGRENYTPEEIYAAAKAARADHFIDTLPEGYNTILDEDGSNISQGQRQLLTIARAINANHEILILDEATSSVDTRTEILIQKAMTVLMKGKTSFVIAHRLSTIRDADTILVMNHGDIVEQGSHAELLAKGGFYSDLYYSQFAK